MNHKKLLPLFAWVFSVSLDVAAKGVDVSPISHLDISTVHHPDVVPANTTRSRHESVDTWQWVYTHNIDAMSEQTYALFEGETAPETTRSLNPQLQFSDRNAIAEQRLISPVPEVETWAMLIVGLGAIGLISNRRKRVVIARDTR